jgi:hypothetical protein
VFAVQKELQAGLTAAPAPAAAEEAPASGWRSLVSRINPFA